MDKLQLLALLREYKRRQSIAEKQRVEATLSDIAKKTDDLENRKLDKEFIDTVSSIVNDLKTQIDNSTTEVKSMYTSTIDTIKTDIEAIKSSLFENPSEAINTRIDGVINQLLLLEGNLQGQLNLFKKDVNDRINYAVEQQQQGDKAIEQKIIDGDTQVKDEINTRIDSEISVIDSKIDLKANEVKKEVLLSIPEQQQAVETEIEAGSDIVITTREEDNKKIYTVSHKGIKAQRTVWGGIKGNIEEQKDLIQYIATHGGGAGAVDSVEGRTGDVTLVDLYQPLEDQRLSTTDDVTFKSVTSVDTIQFNTLFADGHEEGRLQWNQEDGILEYGLSGNTVSLPIGQKEVVKVSNGESTNILNGQVVTFVGSQGGRPKAYRCIAGDEIYGHPCGVATEVINQNGYVTTHGLVRGVNTSGVAVGIIYVSGSGGFSNTRPTAPTEPYCVGICLVSNAENGIIYVNPQDIKFYSELDSRYLKQVDFTDANLITSDITTNNATTLKHGFLPKLSGNATQYLNGQGNFSTITGSSTPTGYSEVSFSGQTSVTVTHNFGVKPLVDVLSATDAILIPLTITHNSDNDFTVTFDESTTGTIIASAGSQFPNITTVNANYTITIDDNIINVGTSGIVITLPTAIGKVGKTYTIDNLSTGAITINCTGAETLQGETYQILSSGNSLDVYSNNTNWRAK